jgi:hypothetical protein
MTIVLQHQFWDLEIPETGFSVTLRFQKQLERLVIPFAAVRSFADPSVNFALEFADPEAKPAASGSVPVLVEAFVITVVGGMGSLGGAIVAGLLLGVVVSLTTLFQPEMAELSMFALMAVTLIVKPQGLFGRKGLLS